MQNPACSLIVKTHAFGDALLATPGAEGLIASGGSWRVLTGPSAAEVWKRLPGISGVTVAPFPPSGTAGLLGFLAWTAGNAARLRGTDRAVVFHSSQSVRRWVRFLTSAPSRSGGSRPLGDWESVERIGQEDLASKTYARIAGVEIGDLRPRFKVAPDEEAWASDTLGPGRWIAIAPGGARNPRDTVRQKQWPAARFGEIARRAGSHGYRCAFVGDAFDRPAASAAAAAAGVPVLDLCGKAGWGMTAAVLARCSAFVGADSGAAHLSTAVSTPAVVLFGPTSPEALYAPGLVSAVRTSAGCAPCYSNEVFRGCARRKAICMLDIDVDAVWASLGNLLNADSGS